MGSPFCSVELSIFVVYLFSYLGFLRTYRRPHCPTRCAKVFSAIIKKKKWSSSITVRAM
jgi:hypothetical protein